MSDPSTIPDKTNEYLHQKLPIGKDEKILGVYRHHWFAYASIWFIGAVVVVAIMAISIGIVATSGSTSSLYPHRAQILGIAAIFCVFVGLFSYIPVWLKSQEQVVLTEEALLQILQPSLFASKISQLGLQELADVSVRQDFFGSMFGYGKISVETPGEQDNYEFSMVPDPHNTAKAIIEAHENFSAALQSGQLPTTLGAQRPVAPQIDPQEFQEFLAFQQAEQAMKNQNTQQPATSPTAGPVNNTYSREPSANQSYVQDNPVSQQQEQPIQQAAQPNQYPDSVGESEQIPRQQ